MNVINTDFGMAQHLGVDDVGESFRGSPLYMVRNGEIYVTWKHYLIFCVEAPEIMLGEPYDAKVDLWSVGVILYGMLMWHIHFYWYVVYV